jgi:hypothetical protein
VRAEFVAYFMALIAIPVGQVLADMASDRHQLIIWNNGSTPVAVSKYHRTKTPFDYLFLPRQHHPKTS